MDLDRLEGLAERRLSRRTLLRGGAFGIGGLAAAALVGCGDDDDDDDDDDNGATPTPTATATPTPTATATATQPPAGGGGGIAAGGVIIEEVVLAGGDATVVLFNTGDTEQAFEGWFLCQFPSYWPLPSMTLAPGGRVTVNAGSGDDTADELFAGGGFGSLSGGRAGEIALYSGGNFGSSDVIVSYVAWNGGSMRKSVAQGAGIWGNDDVDDGDGATIAFRGGDPGAAAYEVR